jgi:hypothetical protein
MTEKGLYVRDKRGHREEGAKLPTKRAIAAGMRLLRLRLAMTAWVTEE